MSGLNPAKEHRTASRVTNILELAAKTDAGVRLADLATALEAPRSSIHGLVKGLVATGYLSEEQGYYSLGPAVSALLAAPRPTLEVAAHPAMEALHSRFNETVMLSFLVGDAVVYIDVVESTQLIRYSAPVRTRRPLYPTSSGKCFLAYADAAFRDPYLSEHVPRSSVTSVREELAQIARDGVALNQGATVPDVCGTSAPIFDGASVVAVLAVAGPISRMADRIEEFAEQVKQRAGEISERLNHESS